jgi:hypothetical protein
VFGRHAGSIGGERALSLLGDSRFDALLSGECRFDDLPATMARLAADPDGALCEVVTYR